MKIKHIGFVLVISLLMAGCVERRLTIVTQPGEAVVWLNDEEVGVAPVTVNFNWYGDYRVRIEKPGYEILNTHRALERPAHDKFPLDFFADIWPGRIEDVYTWNFELVPYQQKSADELIESAQELRQKAAQELGKTAVELLTVE